MKNTTTTAAHPFKSARKAGVPIIAIESADPEATIRACALARNGSSDAFLAWDCIRGLRALDSKNKEDAQRAKDLVEELGGGQNTQNLVSCLEQLEKKAPKQCTIFLYNAQAALSDITALQAIWNCRDTFKSEGSILVLLGPSLRLPPELSNDAILFEEPIPTAEDIAGKIKAAVKDAKKSLDTFPEPDEAEHARICDTLTGYLSLFAIEQSLALATTTKGLDTRKLWELKVSQLKNVSGLQITQPQQKFKDLAGCEGIKTFFGRLLKGKRKIRGVFFADEVEKSLSGSSGDLSGTTQAILEQFLFWVEASNVMGALLLGVPGGGKSHTAACIAGEAGVPLLRGSMSQVKGSLVGQSEANMRNMLKTVDSVCQGATLMVGTCNSFASLPPEVLARFKLGTFFFDYPTQEEAGSIWKLYMDKYELSGAIPPGSSKWVGREIEACCNLAWTLECPLAEAATMIVPVSRANAQKMQDLRQSATGRFLSAARAGVYDIAPDKEVSAGRTVALT